MSNVFIDNEKLQIELPDGFEIMALEKLQALYGMGYSEMWGAKDETRHAVVTVIWKDSGGFATKLMGEESLAKRVEKALSKNYRKIGYRCGDFFEARIADRDARGFRYTYEPEGIPHECEVSVFKDGGLCYTLYYYTRAETAQANRPVYEALLASLAIKG